jgi:tRNA threonylcarbamoyladenosine biosynthesis protein TsaE
LAETLPDGMVVALHGTLGAGKTHLVRAIVAACGVPSDQVVSPTFVLCQQYHARRTIYHLDVYRLADEDEFLNLGPEEYFESAGLVFIEWAERVESCLPDERLDVTIVVHGEGRREFRFVAHGDAAQSALVRLTATSERATG